MALYPDRGISIVEGRGAEVWDEDGTRYIDCVAGIGSCSLGHAHPEVVRAVKRQAERIFACPGIFSNDQRAGLLEELARVAPEGLRRGFLCNSGAESVEAALKFARAATGRTGIVSCRRGFHGRTMGALSTTWKSEYRADFAPLVPGVDFIPFNCVRSARRSIGPETAAVVLELVQGEGGVRPADPAFVRAVRRACDASGALLVVDEVQTGFGRTGRIFASNRYGVVPDILCLAKAIGSGLPLGATLVSDKVGELTGKHGTTSAGSPLACAAARAALRVLVSERLCERANRIGERLSSRIRDRAPARMTQLRQVGLMLGIELSEPVRPYLDALADAGVLALSAGSHVIRLLPPLVIGAELADEAADALVKVLS